ncbi:MAG: oxidoreductase [Nocardioidaceae bacterium]|nr:oxidoreductase [Nocardioidaceae bacterium]
MPSTADGFAAAASLEGVPSALAAARDGIDVLLRDRGMRRTTPELTAESLLRGAAASAAIEGSPWSLADLRAGAGDPVATAAVRLNAGLLSLAPVVTRSPLQAFARLHTLAAAGLVEDSALGRPRAEPGLAARLHRLAQQLVAPTDAPAIAVAAIAHAEIVTLAPFESENGLVARALERLILVARGVDPTSVTVPEGGHLALVEGYRDALTAYGRGDLDGRRAWLLHAATAVTQGAELSPLR